MSYNWIWIYINYTIEFELGKCHFIPWFCCWNNTTRPASWIFDENLIFGHVFSKHHILAKTFQNKCPISILLTNWNNHSIFAHLCSLLNFPPCSSYKKISYNLYFKSLKSDNIQNVNKLDTNKKNVAKKYEKLIKIQSHKSFFTRIHLLAFERWVQVEGKFCVCMRFLPHQQS